MAGHLAPIATMQAYFNEYATENEQKIKKLTAKVRQLRRHLAHLSRIYQRYAPPPMRAVCYGLLSAHEYRSDSDWCLQPDGVPDSRPQDFKVCCGLLELEHSEADVAKIFDVCQNHNVLDLEGFIKAVQRGDFLKHVLVCLHGGGGGGGGGGSFLFSPFFRFSLHTGHGRSAAHG